LRLLPSRPAASAAGAADSGIAAAGAACSGPAAANAVLLAAPAPVALLMGVTAAPSTGVVLAPARWPSPIPGVNMKGAAPGPADANESAGVTAAGGVTIVLTAAAAAAAGGGAAGVRSVLELGAAAAAGCSGSGSGGADSASSVGEPSICTGDSARMPKSCKTAAGQGGGATSVADICTNNMCSVPAVIDVRT
jgi:hypothetical protein